MAPPRGRRADRKARIIELFKQIGPMSAKTLAQHVGIKLSNSLRHIRLTPEIRQVGWANSKVPLYGLEGQSVELTEKPQKKTYSEKTRACRARKRARQSVLNPLSSPLKIVSTDKAKLSDQAKLRNLERLYISGRSVKRIDETTISIAGELIGVDFPNKTLWYDGLTDFSKEDPLQELDEQQTDRLRKYL